jgi:8-hydroxy-5-deazaflavin:NADPH oxidoreductase
MKKVGILGSGIVGKTLASGFTKKGYSVMIGSRTPAKLDDWNRKENSKILTGTFIDTASFGEILVLALKGSIAEEVLKSIGNDVLKDKIIIDATNPIADLPPENGVLRFFTDLNKSLLEKLQNSFPDTRFVKAFNMVGSAHMVDPDFIDGKPSMFICGNDTSSKSTVGKILHEFGWEVEDMGSSEAARAIEPLCMLYCIPGIREQKWNHAFRLLKK